MVENLLNAIDSHLAGQQISSGRITCSHHVPPEMQCELVTLRDVNHIRTYSNISSTC